MAPTQTKPSTLKFSEIARHLVYPTGIVSTGWGQVQKRCAELAIHFDPWQQAVGRLILAKRSDGLYAAGIGGAVLSIPRQVGKTYLIGWIVFALCTLFPDMTVIWTAHHTRTSNETFDSMRTMASTAAASKHVKVVRAANGQQSIVFNNGSRILFGARESGFGRGFAKVDVLVLDEAQILTENAISDMEPATNAAPNGLIIMTGTPPRPKDPSEVFVNRRNEALAGDQDTLYVEFSADEDTNPAKWESGRVDWKQVAKANPSYPHRTSRTAVLRMRKMLTDDSFRREALGVWDKAEAKKTAIPMDKWRAAAVPLDTELSKTKYFAVRFSIDGSHVALAAAAKVGRRRVLVDEVRMESASVGLEWVISFLTRPERLAATAQIVVEGKGGTGYLISQLRANGVPASAIWTPRVDHAIEAHSLFLEGIKSGEIVHWDAKELTREAEWALTRKIGNQGGFGWCPPEGQTVAMLDAATLAAWAAKKSKRRPRGAGMGGRKVVVL